MPQQQQLQVSSVVSQAYDILDQTFMLHPTLILLPLGQGQQASDCM
jgi:hypothetical protein